ncbi:HD domain-containing phosphohydrolase [Rubinisphaera margarita]|uniref:HD domain-containing phosphohydrolase n=1 Tax=Rubinisphaera margarita TaxID=2909586 RepID=UPI001EE94F76|nr:HD domain-containing phosphohydrolase [Rubinisphaera margarita]MCG6154371.1 hypothetical protein [Rubinisphaera margarita]
MQETRAESAPGQGVPDAAAPVADWEHYLQRHLDTPSGCKVRQTRIRQTPQGREQAYLKRLAKTARTSFEKTAVSLHSHRLQRHALDLIQLRRRLIPDGSPAWQRIEVFLAVAQVHQALELLLDEIDGLLGLHQQIQRLMTDTDVFLTTLAAGKPCDIFRLRTILQAIRHAAADATVQTRNWLTTCSLFAELETAKMLPVRRLPLASALQSTYLCARLIRRNGWGLNEEQILAAALLKDVAFWHPKLSEIISRRGHHSEWSAAMVASLNEIAPGTIRMVRQHHECVDGTGIPFGVAAEELHRSDRLLSLITRWTELYQHEMKMREGYSLEADWQDDLRTCNEVMETETAEHRWDAAWFQCLQQEFGIRPPQEIASPEEGGRQLNDWKVPRPNFLKRRFPILGDKVAVHAAVRSKSKER